MSIWVIVGIVFVIFFIKGLLTKIINLPKTIVQMVALGALIYGAYYYILPMLQ